MTSLTATTLYSHEGTASTAIAPATTAEQVKINDEDGVASNLQAEIVSLRKNAAGAFMKTDTADSLVDGTSKVIMTAAERSKLSGIAIGAEANQNAFAKLKVGSTTLFASAKQDLLTIEAGEGVTLTVDEAAKKVTLSEAYIDSCIVSNLDDVPSNLRNGGIVILKE